MKIVILILLGGLVFSSSGLGTLQGNWRTRPYHEWTKQDITELLNDSPWARTQTVSIASRKQLRTIAGQVSANPGSDPVPTNAQAKLGGADAAVNYNFTIRLRSALPIRQAIVRLVQLDANYDTMDAAKKKVLDQQTRDLLACDECASNYIISVGFGSTNSSGIDPVYEWFRNQTVESLRGDIFLQNEAGERRPLTGFIQPRVVGDEAFFLFARVDKDGKPLFTTNNKKLLFRMSDKNANAVTNFSLEISKLIVDGKVAF